MEKLTLEKLTLDWSKDGLGELIKELFPPKTRLLWLTEAFEDELELWPKLLLEDKLVWLELETEEEFTDEFNDETDEKLEEGIELETPKLLPEDELKLLEKLELTDEFEELIKDKFEEKLELWAKLWLELFEETEDETEDEKVDELDTELEIELAWLEIEDEELLDPGQISGKVALLRPKVDIFLASNQLPLSPLLP